MTFLKSAGEENPYIKFEYGPQTILYHTQFQVSLSMNAYPININKQVNNYKWHDQK